MKMNVSAVDRVIRAVLGIGLLVVYFVAPQSGWTLASLIVGLVFVATAAIGWCPIYALLHVSTRHEKGPDLTEKHA